MMDDDNSQQQQQQQKPKGKMAPEAQRITLESVTADCFDSVYAVINGEAEQNSLSEECSKQMSEGYNKSPMGQLQQKETVSTQTAAILRVSASCREEFKRLGQQQQEQLEGAEALQPSETCVEDFQKQYRDMQQWVNAATLSRLSEECKKEAQIGSLSSECEAEFVASKPQIIQTLDQQNEQKAKEPPKEEKKKRNTTGETRKPKVKPAPPLIDPSFLFVVFWTLAIGGTVIGACVYYYRHPDAHSTIDVVTIEPAEKKSKTQLKKEAKAAKFTRRN